MDTVATAIAAAEDANERDLEERDIQGRILHMLSVYPQISPSMLQISLNLPALKWKPALEHLIQDEVVLRHVVVMNTPSGRIQNHTILRLHSTELRLNEDAAV